MKKTITFFRLLPVMMLAVMLLSANGAWSQIAAWQLYGAAGNETSINANTINSNLNTSTLSRGSGLNASALVNVFGSTNFTASGTKTDAITNNKYITFNINAKSGFQVSLSTLDVRFRRSSTGPNAFRWKYSLDGTTFTEIGSADISYTSTTTGGDTQTQINLSGITALQNVLSSTTIVFRLYGWGASATTGTFAIGRSLTTGATDYSLAIGGTVTASGSNPLAATPTFSPAAGNYISSQVVTLATATPAASIYYTTDGTDPNNIDNGTLYSTPIPVSTTTTIKAKAYKDGMDASSIASATYTFPTEVADIATLRTQTTGTTRYKLTGEAILTFKTANRNAKYIQDATGAIQIDDNAGIITTSYNLYDGIKGITGTLALYNSMLQFTPIADPGAATSTGNTVSPVEVTLENLTTNYQAKLVKIKNVSFATTGNFAASTTYNITDAPSKTGVLRTQYTDLDYVTTTTAIPTVAQDLTGVVLQNNTSIQLIPRAVSDFTNSPVAVTFNVDMNGTSGYTDVYVAGSFDDWNATASKMTTSGGNIYTFTTDRIFNVGDVILFKFVKNGPTWENDPNRTYTVVAGTNTVNAYWNAATLPQLDWVNLQSPASATIAAGDVFNVYAQVYEQGLTPNTGQGANVTAWIGYSTTNDDPSIGTGWTWVLASHNAAVTGNNDEYTANIGAGLTGGTYYYASRFKYGLNDYVYGGLTGFWHVDDHKSGVLTVTAAEPAAHATAFTATTNSDTKITVNWTDAADAAGYLIKGSTVSYEDIAAPVDGVSETNGTLVRNVASGVQTYQFTGLTASTPYYFKVFPYNGTGAQMNYKVDGSVPQATATTAAPPTVLNPGDIAILQVNADTPDRFSFVTFVDLNPGTVINFTDNGYTSANAVSINEGILTYTTTALIPAGTVISWFNGTTSTDWSSPGSFALATSGDQLFAYQGIWNSNQKLLYGVNLRSWLAEGGTYNANNSYLPADLTDNVTAFAFSSTIENGYYSNITAGTVNALKSLITYNTNWTTSTTDQSEKTWTFALGNSTTLSDNASVNNLLVAEGETLTLNADKQLTITSAFTNNGTFTLQSGATVITNGGVSGSGTTNVEQWLTVARQWWYLSSPLSAAKTTTFTPSNKIGTYNEATSTYSNPLATDVSLEVGRGYVVKLSDAADKAYTFTGGNLNTGDKTLTLSRTGNTAPKRGFNLVGNPYPSYLDWNLVFDPATATNMRNAIWFRTYDTTESTMAFHTYSDGDGVPDQASSLIAPMQAFWVKVDADPATNETVSNGSLTFKNTHRKHFETGANPLKVKALDARPRLRLVVSNGTSSDEMLVVGKPYASDVLDSYDIEKMSNDNNAIPEVYSVVSNQELVINSMNALTEGKTVTLGFRPGQTGTNFTIEATQLENIDAKVMLQDKVEGTEQELTAGTLYSFEVTDAAPTADRFVISLVSKVPTGIETGAASGGMTVYTNRNNRIQLIYRGELNDKTAVSVYNVAGQKLSTQKVVKAATELSGTYNPGVYMIQLTDNGKKITQKLIIK